MKSIYDIFITPNPLQGALAPKYSEIAEWLKSPLELVPINREDLGVILELSAD
jgi:hypothetical protein